MIELNNKWVFDCDTYNFIPSIRRVKQDGKNKGQVYLTPVAYYSDLSGAVKYVAGQIVKEGLSEDVYTLQEAVEFVDKVYTDFAAALRGIKEVLDEEAGNDNVGGCADDEPGEGGSA